MQRRKRHVVRKEKSSWSRRERFSDDRHNRDTRESGAWRIARKLRHIEYRHRNGHADLYEGSDFLDEIGSRLGRCRATLLWCPGRAKLPPTWSSNQNEGEVVKRRKEVLKNVWAAKNSWSDEQSEGSGADRGVLRDRKSIRSSRSAWASKKRCSPSRFKGWIINGNIHYTIMIHFARALEIYEWKDIRIRTVRKIENIFIGER